MRSNKTKGRGHFNQTIIIAEKKYNGNLNPRVGKKKCITHQLVPKEPPPSNLWGLK